MVVKFPDNRTNPEKHAVNNPSNSLLLQELDTLFESADKTLDVEQVEAKLKQLQKNTPVMQDYDPQKAWELLQAQHPLLMEEDSRKQAELPVESHHRSKTVLRVASIVAASLFAMVIAVGAFGGETVQRVLEWGQNLLVSESEVPSDPIPPLHTTEDYRAVGEMMEEDGYTDHACPTWFPEDYRLQKNTRSLQTESVSYLAVYGTNSLSEPAEQVTLRVQLLTSDQVNLSFYKDEGGYEHTLGSLVFYVYRDDSSFCAVWIKNGFLYRITGDLSETELLQVLDSISTK